MPWAPAQWDSLQNAEGGHRIKWRMVTHFVAFFQVVDVTHKGCCCCPLSVTGELKPKLVSRSVARQHSEDGVLQNHIIPLQVHPLKKMHYSSCTSAFQAANAEGKVVTQRRSYEYRQVKRSWLWTQKTAFYLPSVYPKSRYCFFKREKMGWFGHSQKSKIVNWKVR